MRRLCERPGRGSQAAFGRLVERHQQGLRGFLRRAAGPEADDIAQDAFLAAFERIAEFRGEGTFSAWVRRIAARLYVRRWRKESRYDLDAETADESHGGEISAAARIDLDEALRTLSPAERICVSLCYGAGVSHAEAAEALNAPLGTVKSHVKRGLDKLRLRLAPAEGAHGEPTGSESHG